MKRKEPGPPEEHVPFSELSMGQLIAFSDSQLLRARPDGRLPAADRTASEVRSEELRERGLRMYEMHLAGRNHNQIAREMGVAWRTVRDQIERYRADLHDETVKAMRADENERLNAAQAAIWPQVQEGDLKAVATFLQISARRARMNGLDEAVRVGLEVSVKAEMYAALNELESLVLAPTIKGEIADGTP